MGYLSIVLNVIIITIAVILAICFYPRSTPVMDAKYFEDHYWGPKEWKYGQSAPQDDESIKPFKVNIPNDVLKDLNDRLFSAKLTTASLQDVNFTYGMNTETLKDVIDYWQLKYDWRSQEKLINKYNHYKTQIEGVNIHYLHTKPDAKGDAVVIPLILAHGWPGSFVEFLKIIPLLTDGRDGLAFELIIPSLPGYGFSEASHRPGLDGVTTARIFSKLMTRLGHKYFMFHGGDWGSIVGKFMAIMYPDRVIGLHVTTTFLNFALKDALNMFVGKYLPKQVYGSVKEAETMNPFNEKIKFLLSESGYFHLHTTKPDTIGIGLTDSPAGLAAYILEKFSTWTDRTLVNEVDGGLLSNKVKYSLDDLLTNVMIYWTTSSITSSARYYKEVFGTFDSEIHRVPIPKQVAIGISYFKHELIKFPKVILNDVYTNIIQYKHHDKGGHFGAFELPEVVNDDIRSFVSRLKNELYFGNGNSEKLLILNNIK